MSGSKSDYAETAILNHLLRATALGSPTVVYVALYTVAPTDAGGGTEVTGGAYVRRAATFAAPAAGVTSNSVAVTFPIATASWGTVVAFGVFDALAVGNLLYWATLTVNRLIDLGDQANFAIGALVVTED